MTCIAAVIDRGKVWMAGDSAGTSSNFDLSRKTAPKVFARGEFLIGYTTSFRMGQLLQYTLATPDPGESRDLAGFMVVDFVGAVRDCLKSGGWAEKDKERESGGNFLIGFRGRIFELYSDYHVSETIDDYLACGSGEPYAKGSLHSTRGGRMAPEERLRMALAAAEHHCAAVHGPFTVLSL